MAIDGYTHLQGSLKIGGVAYAFAEFDLGFTRKVLTHARAAEYSDLNLPGGIEFTGTMKRIQIDGELIGKLLGDTTTSGSAVALHAGLSPTTGAGTENITDMTDTASLSSRIKLTALTAAITTAGYAKIIGTDVNDTRQEEDITLTTLGINETVTGKKIFKTTTHVALFDMAQVGGTIKVDAVAGAASIVVGAADEFTIEGKVLNSSDDITMTVPGCFFTKAGLVVADGIMSDELEFMCKSPSAITETYNAT